MEIDLSKQRSNADLSATPHIVRQRLVDGLPLGLEAAGLLGRCEESVVNLWDRCHGLRLSRLRAAAINAPPSAHAHAALAR